jgi:SAM-dependent methyltransferase
MDRMPPVPESSAGPAAQTVANDYDRFAEAYAADTEANLINGYYARPAIVDLAGDVAGRRILDAGCGSGPIAEALRERGAIVTGIDSSAKMVELARRRLGADADLQVADLDNPLPFPVSRVRRRHRFPGAALPGGLDGAAGRTATGFDLGRQADFSRQSSAPLPA